MQTEQVDLRVTTLPGRLRLAKGDRRWEDIRTEARVGERTLERMLYPRDPDAPAGPRGEGKSGPTLDVIARLARALGVRAGWLAFGDEAMR